MRRECASAGFYASPWGKHPRLQILTIEDLLTGKVINRPPAQTSVTFRRTPKAAHRVAETRSMPFGEPSDSALAWLGSVLVATASVLALMGTAAFLNWRG